MNWKQLHAVNPYAGFEAAAYPRLVEGWNCADAVFADLIAEVRPQLIVEVGSWLGASALHMAEHIESHAKIVCVDTWLGSLEFWTDQKDLERYQRLNLKHGYPSVYYQFLANVVHAGQQKMIIPFPQTSQIAARWFAEKRIQPDLVYLDASHEREDVRADLSAWFKVVRVGGVIFGDDYCGNWPGVMEALDPWPKEIRGEKWIIRKI